MWNKDIKFIVTVASKAELPISWLKDNDVPFYSFSALKNSFTQITNSKKGIIFIITGIGYENSKKSAEWICNNFTPLCILNIGTAGSFDKNIPRGSWIIPEFVCDEKGSSISIESRLPVPALQASMLIRKGRLLTSSKPVLNETIRPGEFSYVDMEAYTQAEKFKNAGMSFHVLKWISDHADLSTQKEYPKSLIEFQHEFKKVFAFLEGPGKPDISVVIPVYNRGQWIWTCVNSVLRQKLPPKEIIVVDDGSTDDTRNVLKLFGNSIRVCSLPKTSGVSAARNKGILESSAKWISFLDSDDYWSDEKLLNQWKFLEKNPFFEILQSEEIWLRHGVRVNACLHHKKPEGWIWKKSVERCYISPSSVLLKRTLFDEFGLFDNTYPSCEDYELWLRISRWKMVGLESTPSLIKRGGHEDQLSRRYAAMDWFRVRAILKALESESNPEYRDYLRKSAASKLTILRSGSEKRKKNATLEWFNLALKAVTEDRMDLLDQLRREDDSRIYSHIEA